MGLSSIRDWPGSLHDPRLRNECDADPANTPYDAARAVFRPGGDPLACGQPLAPGDTLVQPDLARTFRLIAAGGAAAFYDCDHPAGIARAIVAAQRSTRVANAPAGVGGMSCGDLAGYRAAIRQPVEGEYRGYIVRSAPPPSSGGLVLLQILKMLERFPIGAATQRIRLRRGGDPQRHAGGDAPRFRRSRALDGGHGQEC